MAGTFTTTGKGVPTWPKDAFRITFGIIWLIDATLKWLPGFRSGYMSSISGAGMGQPGWTGNVHAARIRPSMIESRNHPAELMGIRLTAVQFY